MPATQQTAQAADATFAGPDASFSSPGPTHTTATGAADDGDDTGSAGACPQAWPALHAGAPEAFDGTVSVLVGGDLVAGGTAGGAEGVVVVRGGATFALDAPGSYAVGTTPVGSQVAPYAGSDMLTVGGGLAAAPGTLLDVGAGLGGDVVVGQQVAPESAADLHGGRLDTGHPEAVDPYAALLAFLPVRSAAYAGTPDTGLAEVSDTAITLTGDGASDPQVFTLDGAALGPVEGAGRTLQLLGVPAGASVVVNLTGPDVDLAVDGLLAADGTPIDPTAGPAFADLATHLLWNAPGASTVDITGQGQLPGSVLVPSAPSTTTISGGGTNGRLLVAGDLVHTGAGTLHSYPFTDDALQCGPALAHLGVLNLDVELQDPDGVVEEGRSFQGEFRCELDGQDVTPGTATWQQRAVRGEKLVADGVPVGAVCTVTERLQVAPAKGYTWADPVFAPERVRIAKREPRTIVVTNRVKELPPPPVFTSAPTPTSDPTSTPTTTPPPVVEPVDDGAPMEELPGPTVGPTSLPEPTNRPTPEVTAPGTAEPEPAPTVTPTADAAVPGSEAPRAQSPTAPLTTAPFTLRGSFVWAPLLILSLLTLLLRVRRRPKRLP